MTMILEVALVWAVVSPLAVTSSVASRDSAAARQVLRQIVALMPPNRFYLDRTAVTISERWKITTTNECCLAVQSMVLEMEARHRYAVHPTITSRRTRVCSIWTHSLMISSSWTLVISLIVLSSSTSTHRAHVTSSSRIITVTVSSTSTSIIIPVRGKAFPALASHYPTYCINSKVTAMLRKPTSTCYRRITISSTVPC
uniref:Putative secreted protein n=1 Tax=Anopheles triannulatus TaxID=58253 RepID=A0A2M4B220_9DIPT